MGLGPKRPQRELIFIGVGIDRKKGREFWKSLIGAPRAKMNGVSDLAQMGQNIGEGGAP